MAIAFVSNGGAANVNPGVSSLVVPVAIAASAVAVVAVGIQSPNVTVLSITDDQNNTYTKRASVLASRETDYPRDHYNINSEFDYYVEGEIWTATNGATPATKVTVNLTSGARFGAEVNTYSGVVTGIGANASATAQFTTAPSISLTTTAANSFVVAGFCSALGDNAIQGTGTLRGQVESFAKAEGIEVAVADNTAASATPVTVALADGAQAQSTYAMVAVELKL